MGVCRASSTITYNSRNMQKTMGQTDVIASCYKPPSGDDVLQLSLSDADLYHLNLVIHHGRVRRGHGG